VTNDQIAVTAALVGAAWAAFAEWRIQGLRAELAALKQGEIDAEIDSRNQHLSDDELNALVRKDLGD
jgi:hypothetical protein